MISNRVTAARLGGLIVAAAFLGGCGTESGDGAPGAGAAARPQVVATTTMIADLAGAIAGDRADVHGIMKPGEDPHVYDVRPRDAQMIADADLILMNGLHLEATLIDVVEHNAENAVVVRLAESDRIKPLGSETKTGAPDPHCWFNVSYFKIYAQGVRDALIRVDPANADTYRANAAAYIAQLDDLDVWVQHEIDKVPRERRVMVTSHDAFQYFGDRYDIDVLAVIGISTEQQPRPQDVARLEEKVRSRGVRALFIETSVVKTLNDLVRKIAAATGARIGGTLHSDSLGEPGTEAGTYLGMVRHNVNTIVEALK